MLEFFILQQSALQFYSQKYSPAFKKPCLAGVAQLLGGGLHTKDVVGWGAWRPGWTFPSHINDSLALKNQTTTKKIPLQKLVSH